MCTADEAERNAQTQTNIEKAKESLKKAEDDLGTKSKRQGELEAELLKNQAVYEDKALNYSIAKSYVDTWNFFFPEAAKENRTSLAQSYGKAYDRSDFAFAKCAEEREKAAAAGGQPTPKKEEPKKP